MTQDFSIVLEHAVISGNDRGYEKPLALKMAAETCSPTSVALCQSIRCRV